MALIEINKNPSLRELRWFGLLFLLFWGIVGGIVYVSAESFAVTVSIWLVALAVVVLYYLIPALRRPLYLGWLYAAFPIGWVVSHFVMVITFYLVVTPIGLLMRLLGRDPMKRRLDESAETYWVAHSQRRAERYFRQF